MTDQTKIQADAAAEAPAKVAKAVAETIETSANETVKATKRALGWQPSPPSWREGFRTAL